MFNQLLGINNGNVIVGYFGDGMEVANNGYVLVPANHYSLENFTNVANCTNPPASPCPTQTQAIGINEASGLAGATPFADIVGFYTDIAGVTHGFLDSVGVQSTIDDPNGVKGINTPVQNLLGINNALRAAGFWTDNDGHEHGFVVRLTALPPPNSAFVELTPQKVSTDVGGAAVATQTSDITNNNLVCGFWTDANDNNHGFTVFLNTGANRFNTVQPLTPKPPVVNVKSLSPFGCNDNGLVVGSFTAMDGTVHGFVFDGMDWHQYDAAGSSQTATKFGVFGTTINGINNAGTVVGFLAMV